ncbi:MAG: GNAT family N-acetyltransferase [Clostridia bacterium]|nr:GNAT family N-acetyltransferase [Clostridia bacterium]
MKEILLRKAKLIDFDVYRNLYDDYDAQFLYSGPDSDDDVDNYEETLYNLRISEDILDKVDVEEDYKKYHKGIYFICVDQVIIGYIRTEKKGKGIIIRDMTIKDYSIKNERPLCRLFNVLFKATKAENIIIFYCNPVNRKILQRIGFTFQGHLEKIAGI